MKRIAYDLSGPRFRLVERGVENKVYSLEYKSFLGWRQIFDCALATHTDDVIEFASIKEAREWVVYWYGRAAVIDESTWRVA